MKIIILFAIALIFCKNTFSQTKEAHLQKSRHLKTVAWVLAGGGTALTVGGFVLILDGSDNRYNNNYYGYDNGNNNTAKILGGAGLMVMGLAAIGTSIPFFIRSHKEHKRAIAFSIKNENIQVLQYGRLTRQLYPALSFRINFVK
jgi:hypothetical protein